MKVIYKRGNYDTKRSENYPKKQIFSQVELLSGINKKQTQNAQVSAVREGKIYKGAL